MCAICREKRIYTRVGKKNDKAAGGSSQCSYRSLSPKRQGKKGGGLMVEYTPTRRIQKLWACMFWMLRRTTYFSCVLSALLFSPAAATQQIWGLRAAVFQWSDARVLQSQVFVFISTGINRLSRQRSRPSAITGPEAGSSTCFSIFTK